MKFSLENSTDFFVFGENNEMKDYIENNITILEVTENIQKAQAEVLDEKLFNLYNNHNKNNLLLDLRFITHICSSALGTMVSYKRIFNKEGVDIKIIASSEELIKLFNITMLDKVFEIYNSKEDAMISFPENDE